MSIREKLAGRRIGVTGVTGFVGQALLSRLLAEVPDARLVVLARARGAQSAADRVDETLTTSSALVDLRSDDAALARARSTIEVVDADLDAGEPALGALDVLVHVAGTVSFDTPIDEAFSTHTTGVDRLYGAAVAAGCGHIVHVSTAYVAARRPGPVPEEPCRGDLDWRAEAAAAEDLAHRAEMASRQPRRLSRFLADARRAVGAYGDEAVGEEAERARREWVRRQLVEAGRQRALTLGFSDVYTLTKALGERVAEERAARTRLSVVRPTIIESARRDPRPGWIEGFKVADPLIVGFGRADIPDFPGFPDIVVDLVPVDHVANALIVAAADPPEPGRPRHITVGTGARNPLTLSRLHALVHDYFESHPLPAAEGGAVRLPRWRFAGPDRLERQLDLATRATRLAHRAVERTPVGGARVRDLERRIHRTQRRLDTLNRFAEIYGGYGRVESVFLDDTAQALRDRLSAEDHATFGFDPHAVDWGHYLREVHVPAVTAGFRDAPPGRPRRSPSPPPLTPADGRVLAVFDLDGTVARANVLTAYLQVRWHDDRLAFAREAADVLRELPRYLALDAVGRERFLRAFYRRFAGADVAALDRLVSDRLAESILRDLSPAAVRRIRAHREQGHTTVLLTGALRSLCEPLRSLFDVVAAAELEVGDDGRATGNLASPPLVGATRAAWLRAYAREVGADLRASYAYADSRSDVPMLRAVGNPVAVDPDTGLHRVARQQRWPVATWREGERRAAEVG